MEQKIQDLYRELKRIAAFYLIHQKRDNVEEIKKKIPQIQEFVMWFLEENRYGIEEELYQGMSQDLLGILKDILAAFEQRDMVLMHDAVTYGLIEYLDLFMDAEEEDRTDDSI